MKRLKFNFVFYFFLQYSDQNERKKWLEIPKLERKPLQCGQCEEILKGTFNLKRHIKRKHASEGNKPLEEKHFIKLFTKLTNTFTILLLLSMSIASIVYETFTNLLLYLYIKPIKII